jgi:hypothetical protein
MSFEEVYIGCRCGDEDCHYAAAGQPWCAGCEEHIRLERLTDDGECPRHPPDGWEPASSFEVGHSPFTTKLAETKESE